jgi:hypothetical protein
MTDALHLPGAKDDAGKQRWGLVLGDFAPALAEVVKVGTFGAKKYTDGGWLQVPNGIKRYSDAALRHAAAHAMGELNDPETGLPHLAHVAWNALAVLTLQLRAGGGRR